MHSVTSQRWDNILLQHECLVTFIERPSDWITKCYMYRGSSSSTREKVAHTHLRRPCARMVAVYLHGLNLLNHW